MTEVIVKTLKTDILKKCGSCPDGYMEYEGHSEEIFGVTQYVHICDHCNQRAAYAKQYPIHTCTDYFDVPSNKAKVTTATQFFLFKEAEIQDKINNVDRGIKETSYKLSVVVDYEKKVALTNQLEALEEQRFYLEQKQVDIGRLHLEHAEYNKNHLCKG